MDSMYANQFLTGLVDCRQVFNKFPLFKISESFRTLLQNFQNIVVKQ